MRLRRLCARCAIALVAHHEHAAPRADKVVSQESVGRDALAALVVPLDACESRGKDDCLRAPPSCARVSIQLGSSKVCRDVRVNVDFLVGVSDDLLAAERSMHLEGKTNGDARGREIATCAAVGAEIRTCIRRLVRAWPLEPTSGRGAVSPRSPGSHRVSQWANPKMHPYWNCVSIASPGSADVAVDAPCTCPCRQQLPEPPARLSKLPQRARLQRAQLCRACAQRRRLRAKG